MIVLCVFLAFAAGWIGRSLRYEQLRRRRLRRAMTEATREVQAKVGKMFDDGMRDMLEKLLMQPTRPRREQPDRLVEVAEDSLRHDVETRSA